jgi:prepilin signal peptidase PulO-like enzyme (type II secretory pathway)
MGFGDVKLVAVGGLWLGPWGLPWIMLVGGVSTLIGAAVVSAIKGQAVWRGEMPLGPGLAAGILGCFVAGLWHMPWLRLTVP